MGDRTSVTLTVLTSQAAQAKKIFGDEAEKDPWVEGLITSFIFNEVNYGELDFLDKLQDTGIAYDSNWSSGDEYSAGTTSCRFSAEGGIIKKSVYDDELNPCMHTLLAVIDDPTQLRQAILDHKAKVTVAPLDEDQEVHGKIYRTLNLVGAVPVPE